MENKVSQIVIKNKSIQLNTLVNLIFLEANQIQSQLQQNEVFDAPEKKIIQVLTVSEPIYSKNNREKKRKYHTLTPVSRNN